MSTTTQMTFQFGQVVATPGAMDALGMAGERLFEYLIRTYTNPGDVVMDNCIGSGTTAVAAENTGRRWIGIERDEGYFIKAWTRVMGL